MAAPDELTLRRLNRATLARQLLLRREPIDVVDAVRRVVAIQAQEPASTHLALWNRIEGFDGAALHDAFVDGRVVKATLMRITLHAVAAEDRRPFHHAVVPLLRASRLNDRRFAEAGLSVDELDRLVPDLLGFAGDAPRTSAEIEAWLEERTGRPVPRAWWAMRTFAPIVHAATGGPWSYGRRPVYRAVPSASLPDDHGASVRHLVRRALEGFGPATAQDLGQFTFLRMPTVKAALAAMADELDVLTGPGGTTLHDVPDGARPAADTPAPPRLLPMWDSTLLAYADRARVLPAEHRASVIRRNGDVLPAVLVDGFVAGVWRTVGDGVEITAFQRLDDDAWAGLAVEAERLLAFLAGRDPTPYRRYERWWSDLPAADVRIVPA